VYVRMLLTHGARSVVWHAKAAAHATALQRWAVHTELRRGHNVAAVAVANIARPDRVGRLGAATPVHGRPPAWVIVDSTVAHLEDCTERIAPWRTGRTGAGPRR
jgi:hypothetical protein